MKIIASTTDNKYLAELDITEINNICGHSGEYADKGLKHSNIRDAIQINKEIKIADFYAGARKAVRMNRELPDIVDATKELKSALDKYNKTIKDY